MKPLAERLVEDTLVVDTDCSTELPETVRTPPTVANPEAERFVEETVARLDWPETVWKPDTLEFVVLTLVSDTEPKVAAPVTARLATCKLPVPVALVKVTPCKADVPPTVNAPEIVSKPLMLTLVPEALVKFMLWSREAPETVRAPPIVPNPDALKLVLETLVKVEAPETV